MRRLRGARPRWIAAVAVALAALAAAWLFVVRGDAVVGQLQDPEPTAVIGSGSDALAVGASGQILDWLPPPGEGTLPELPLSAAPKKGVLGGTVLAQARVLGAAPAPLRPHIESSYLGDSGIDVMLRSGIELRFGDASRAARKWAAAATVLADPATTSLDYVNLDAAPSRVAIGGSGHALPPPP